MKKERYIVKVGEKYVWRRYPFIEHLSNHKFRVFGLVDAVNRAYQYSKKQEAEFLAKRIGGDVLVAA